MYKRTGDILRILLGVYLLWLGIRLLTEVNRAQPSNMVFLCAAAVLFIAAGGGYAGYYAKKMSGIHFHRGKKKASEKVNTKSVSPEEIQEQKAMAQTIEMNFSGVGTTISLEEQNLSDSKPSVEEEKPEESEKKEEIKKESGEKEAEDAAERENDLEDADSEDAGETKLSETEGQPVRLAVDVSEGSVPEGQKTQRIDTKPLAIEIEDAVNEEPESDYEEK